MNITKSEEIIDYDKLYPKTSDVLVLDNHRDIKKYGSTLNSNYEEIVRHRIEFIGKLMNQKKDNNLQIGDVNFLINTIGTNDAKCKKIDCNEILVLPSISRKDDLSYGMTLKDFLEDENIDPFIELCYLILSYFENIRNHHYLNYVLSLILFFHFL